MAAQLRLFPQSDAPRAARTWVREQLRLREQPELTSAAVLAVSELVTNVVVHVRTELVVRIDDGAPATIEVHDSAPYMAGAQSRDGGAGRLGGFGTPHSPDQHTVGRGLRIVASVSERWGVSYEATGKYIWFVPVAEDTGPSSSPQPLLAGLPVTSHPSDQRPIAIHLIDVPLQLLVRYRHRFGELRRELTLMSMNHGHTFEVAERLALTAMEFDSVRTYYEESTAQLEKGLAADRDRADFHFEVTAGAVQKTRSFTQALRDADEFCRRENLLALTASPQELAFREWVLDQIVAQFEGKAPSAWKGRYAVDDGAGGGG